MRLRERIKHSLFFKIILIFLAAHLTIAAVGYTMHKYFNPAPHHHNMDKNMVRYSSYLIKEMGLPPDTSIARKLADSLQIAIQFSSQDFKWSSEALAPYSNSLHWQTIKENPLYAVAFNSHGLLLQYENNKGTYRLLFKSKDWDNRADMQWRILIMVLFMMLVLTIIYYIIRRLLQPIEQLDEATRQLSAGNLDYQLNTARKDELGELAQSFNYMTLRIKEMIKARDQLLLDASHELRSPLTRIKVALEFIEDSSAKENIRSDIDDMETMISELLEKERLDSPHGGLHITTLNLSEIVQKVCAAYEKQKPGIVLDIPTGPVEIQGDSDRLRMALDNIVQNAIKFSAKDGQAVKVKVQQTVQDVLITVQDFGAGIPADEIGYIFEPFYRVDKSRSKQTGGYGLGMSLVKKIIDMHKGTIELQSAPGKGTLVKIRLQIS